MLKSVIKILDIDKYSIILSVNGEEKVINIDDATDIMVTKNYI